MIPVSLSWDTRKKSISLKWRGLLLWERKGDRGLTKIFGFPLPLGSRSKEIRLPMRLTYLKEIFSVLTQWRIKKVEGTFSFPDPMVNGVLFGWISALNSEKTDPKIDVTINFSGENWCRGEAVMSPAILFHHFKRWILPLLKEIRGGRPEKGGDE